MPDVYHTTIGGHQLTLFYDYDSAKLKDLTAEQRIDWFSQRMYSLLVFPLRKLFDLDSSAYHDLNRDNAEDQYPNFYTIMLIQFEVLLNAVESLGSFIRIQGENDRKANWKNFLGYVKRYLPNWNKTLKNVITRERDVPSILWKHYRNALAHGLRIRHHGIEYHGNTKRFKIDKNGSIQSNPILFFSDFDTSFTQYLSDIRNNPTIKRVFIERFDQIYQEGK